MFEREPVQPLRVQNNTAAEAWLKGYADGYNGREVNLQPTHAVKYLRGYIAGLKSRGASTVQAPTRIGLP